MDWKIYDPLEIRQTSRKRGTKMKAKLIIEDKEIEIEISAEEYKKLQPLEEKKTGYERVAEDSEFYYESPVSNVESSYDERYSIDDEHYESANYYSSEIVAENNARADNLMRQLRRFSVEHRECGVNFNDMNTKKFCIYYNYRDNELEPDFLFSEKAFGAIYFDSEETARAAIDEFRDELIWYFTEYKDSL